ncbi:MAG: hypothetical protein CM15mP89_1900 [Gammaproteobacteria bacterium]|nr:MAG: hypothetical protein CM15mP89_1900 [Gammaproteobacteria bacterium]
MPRMILLLAVALTLVILIRRAQRQPPHKRRSAYLQIILGSAVVGVIILTLMGKMHWIGAALTGALVLARQMLPCSFAFCPCWEACAVKTPMQRENNRRWHRAS